MAVRKIALYGHPALRKVSSDITDFSNIETLIEDLFDTMYEFDGIGLAANQIGIDKRIFVVDINHIEKIDKEFDKPLVFINGKLDDPSGSSMSSEGCLSLPGIRAEVERYESIKYSYLDENLKKCSRVFSGLPATVIQHENDHLDGKLITDSVNPVDLAHYAKMIKDYKERKKSMIL
tara:strand:+ start:236 stop:766 length:531 start_codon:yes stop_codon:yes gene_type:complete